MKYHNRTGQRILDYIFQATFRRYAVIKIAAQHIPHDHAVTVHHHPCLRAGDAAIRRPKKFGMKNLIALQYILQVRFGRSHPPVDVAIGMVADGMAFLLDSGNNFGIPLRILPPPGKR